MHDPKEIDTTGHGLEPPVISNVRVSEANLRWSGLAGNIGDLRRAEVDEAGHARVEQGVDARVVEILALTDRGPLDLPTYHIDPAATSRTHQLDSPSAHIFQVRVIKVLELPSSMMASILYHLAMQKVKGTKTP